MADSSGFSAQERAAMKERAKELKAAKSRAAGEADVLAKIAQMPDADRVLAERIHALVAEHAPQLQPRTWYGMPAYALDGKIVCFFQDAAKFKYRYATLGFQDAAQLDNGDMWATSFAVVAMTPEVKERIVDLLGRALS